MNNKSIARRASRETADWMRRDDPVQTRHITCSRLSYFYVALLKCDFFMVQSINLLYARLF